MMRWLGSIFLGGSFLALVALAQPVLAQDDHEHGDIEFGYEEGRIVVETGEEGRVFEGEFPLEGIERLLTSEPGFASEISEGMGIGPNDQIVYNVLDSLKFWNDGFKPLPADVKIRIINSPPAPAVPDTIVGGNTGVQLGAWSPVRNRVGAADGTGDFHTDLDFVFEPNPAGDVPADWYGAYGIQLSLTTDAAGIGASEPFFLVFNLGLEEEAFEEGVASFAALVPEPQGVTLLVSAASMLMWGRRRRG